MSDRLLTLAATQWEVVSTADATRLDVDPNALAELVRAGTLVRVRRGAYVVGEQWAAASPERRLDLRTRAVLHARAHPGEAATHQSALAVHGLPLHGVATDVVDLVGQVKRGMRQTDPASESVGETRARYLVWSQGLPAPEVNYPICDEYGREVARVDLAWPAYGVFLEFDGKVKYERLLRPGESAADVVFREKQREDMICRLTGWRCIRLIWAELDSNPTSVDPGDDGPGGINANPGNTGPVNLIIRPARNFDFGERYIVALRNLRNADDQPIEAPIGFRVYRDDDITDQPEVESRRPHMESIIDTLTGKAGVDRKSLYMAWDFTVASEQSVTGRATTIRDDAFARLGDTDLTNRTIEGDSPDWTITRVLDQGDPIPPGERGLPSQIARRVEGTINVPCYLDEDGCPSGAEFAHGANGDITWNSSYDRDVVFRCEIPDSVLAGDGPVAPAAVGIYGHGLLGTQSQLTGQAAIAQQENTIWCAMDFEGFAEQDLGTVIAALADMSNFKQLADRMQQGYVNFMYLGRALIHPDGLATDAAFAMDNGDGSEPRQCAGVPRLTKWSDSTFATAAVSFFPVGMCRNSFGPCAFDFGPSRPVTMNCASGKRSCSMPMNGIVPPSPIAAERGPK